MGGAVEWVGLWGGWGCGVGGAVEWVGLWGGWGCGVGGVCDYIRKIDALHTVCSLIKTQVCTANPIFLTVLYFSDLETHQNLTSINFGEQDNTHNIQYIIFISSRDNI